MIYAPVELLNVHLDAGEDAAIPSGRRWQTARQFQIQPGLGILFVPAAPPYDISVGEWHYARVLCDSTATATPREPW